MTAKRSKRTKPTTIHTPAEQRDYDWFYANYGEFARRYPNQWVAFADRRVLAAGPNMMGVLRRAQRLTGRREIPHLFVEYGIHVYAHPA